MKKLILVVTLLVVPSAVKAQGIGEVLQGLLDPHIVAGVSYNTELKTYSAVVTANIVGPKLGTLPCYASGVGVALGTVAPGLEDIPIAAASFPVLTCAPFGEQVVIQTGFSVPLNNSAAGKSVYAGLGVSVSGGPNALKAKRAKRAEAKAKAKKAAKNIVGPPDPLS